MNTDLLTVQALSFMSFFGGDVKNDARNIEDEE